MKKLFFLLTLVFCVAGGSITYASGPIESVTEHFNKAQPGRMFVVERDNFFFAK